MPPLNAQPILSDLDGRTRAIVVTPAATSDWSIQVPDGFFWDFLSLAARLVTSSAVGNRAPVFTFDDGANRIWTGAPAGTQGPSLTVDYLFGEGLSRDATVAANSFLPVPTDLRLFAGWRVFVVTTALQNNDLWSAVLTIREYQTNPVTGPRASSRYRGWSPTRPGGAPRRPGRAY